MTIRDEIKTTEQRARALALTFRSIPKLGARAATIIHNAERMPVSVAAAYESRLLDPIRDIADEATDGLTDQSTEAEKAASISAAFAHAVARVDHQAEAVMAELHADLLLGWTQAITELERLDAARRRRSN